jgi:hypothetical protein
MFEIEVFWVVMPCSVVVGYQRSRGPLLSLIPAIHIEDGGSMNLRNIGILPQHYPALRPRRPQLETGKIHAIGIFFHSFTCCTHISETRTALPVADQYRTFRPLTQNFVVYSQNWIWAGSVWIISTCLHTRIYQKVSRLTAWSENCKWYSSLPLSAVVLLFCESV